MSSHPHATVRAAAQQSISNLGRAFESFVNKALPGLTKILTDKSPPHASVTGAIYILAQPRSLQLCTESWPQLQNFLLALCDSETMVNSQPVDYQQKLSARLQILLIRYMRSAEIPPIRTPSDAAICKDLILRFIALGEGGGGSVSSPTSPFLRPCDSPNSSGKQQQDDRSSGSRHWRYQLTATCCAIHLLARAGQVSALPVEVWEQVMKSIADTGGEGQPLQQLSLMALGHLFVARISQPEAERIPREVLLDLMLHRSHGGCKDGGFMTMLVRAISHLHTKSREDGGGGAESIGGRSSSPQWSLGVGEILSDAKKRYRSALKCTWGNIMLSPHRRNGRGPFVSSHARLIAFLVKACGMEILPALLQAMDTASERAAEEDKNTIQCTIAEVVAGCVWGVLALEGGEVEEHVKDMWSMVIPFVETKLEKANMDMQLLWNQALARMISNQPADALEPLTGMLEIQALKVLRGWRTRDDFATQAKWLFMVQAPLLELPRERATQLGLKLSPELISAASHQFKLCREKIGTCLGIITCFTSVDKEWLLRLAEENTGLGWNLNNNNDPENRFSLSTLSISSGMAVDERPNGNYPSQSTEEEEEEEQKLITTRQDELNNRSQTFIHWILSCLKYGDASVYVLPVIRLLPAVMYAVHSRKVEVNSAGKNCIMQLSTSIRICCRSHLTALPIILSTMTSFTTHESWQVRILAASLCCQFHSEHYLILSSEEASQLEKPIQFLLRDDHREVQDHCCNCLTLQLSFMDFKSVSKLANKLISESDKFVSEAFKKRKRCKVKGVNHVKKSAPSIDTDAKLHQACVLGLSSMVLSHPYEMAPYTAAAVVAIARHADAGGFVKEIVTKVLAEFKRTRTGKDWEEQRQCFTTVQLDAYHDASAVPSYFS